MTLLSAGCRGQPGAAFSSASILAPPPEEEAAHDELLRADLARADSVAHLGFADGSSSSFSPTVLYLRGGLPIIRGRNAARAVIAAELAVSGVAVRWQPVRVQTSRDRHSGYSYGYAIYSKTPADAPAILIDRYIAFWQKINGAWGIVAYAETYGSPPPQITLPEAARSAIVADVAMSRSRAAVDVIRAADADFSAEATRLGTGEAFGKYAAPDAQIFSPLGEFVTGPEAITASFSAPIGRSSFAWHPVDGEVAASGDLGFTVGNAEFTGEREDGAPVMRYSKYLTVWKRQPDGSWRYVVDGGSGRPAPPSAP